eukprot:7385052-Prymnesium_polylepis.5
MSPDVTRRLAASSGLLNGSRSHISKSSTIDLTSSAVPNPLHISSTIALPTQPLVGNTVSRNASSNWDRKAAALEASLIRCDVGDGGLPFSRPPTVHKQSTRCLEVRRERKEREVRMRRKYHIVALLAEERRSSAAVARSRVASVPKPVSRGRSAPLSLFPVEPALRSCRGSGGAPPATTGVKRNRAPRGARSGASDREAPSECPCTRGGSCTGPEQPFRACVPRRLSLGGAPILTLRGC